MGFSFTKLSCNERTWYMQHQSLAGSRTGSWASMRSCASIMSSWPITSVSATLFSASFFTCDFVHCPHFPGGTFPLFISNILSQTDTHSCNTACILFGLPHRVGSGWSVGNERSWGWPQVLSLLDFGGGLLGGIVVDQRCLCFPPGFLFMWFTLSASGASPSCADE